MEYRDAKKLIEDFASGMDTNPDSEYTNTKYSLFNYLTSISKKYRILNRSAIEQVAGEMIL